MWLSVCLHVNQRWNYSTDRHIQAVFNLVAQIRPKGNTVADFSAGLSLKKIPTEVSIVRSQCHWIFSSTVSHVTRLGWLGHLHWVATSGGIIKDGCHCSHMIRPAVYQYTRGSCYSSGCGSCPGLPSTLLHIWLQLPKIATVNPSWISIHLLQPPLSPYSQNCLDWDKW